MNDNQAINFLLTDYCLALDEGRIDDCAALFKNAEFTFKGFPTAKGIEGVKGMFANLIIYEDGTPRTRHLLTNVRIDVADGANAATSQGYLIVMQQVDEAPMQPIFSGHYVDEFEIIEGNWQFSRRNVLAPQFGDMSRHTRGL
ncbi:nuclear transport factor 2 family protein [Maritalea porphyrae]|uniref:nuclear transport factor 2 family protein n=1 Tax=Maritalea porphyrae TaxID=880732 RepID=UPI0022AE6994|nr:nuclear transport factor 2 family protein [Maritalea porphyrae]MCZ4274131.1 nuclear transport factor 2 family protein [Maritalea porphyrae]